MDKLPTKTEQKKALVDEYGALNAELSPIRVKLKRFEELARVIRSWHAEADAETSQRSAGDSYEVLLGPCESKTIMASTMEILKALGRTKFLEACSMTVKALEAATDPATFSRLTRKERIGTRPLVVHAITKAKAA